MAVASIGERGGEGGREVAGFNSTHALVKKKRTGTFLGISKRGGEVGGGRGVYQRANPEGGGGPVEGSASRLPCGGIYGKKRTGNRGGKGRNWKVPRWVPGESKNPMPASRVGDSGRKG